MEVKKAPKADLEGRKGLFLEIGLCVSLVLMIGAFAWGQGKREAPAPPPAPEEFVQTEVVENTIQDIPVPQVPTPAQTMSVISDAIKIVDNNTQVKTNDVFVDFQENMNFNAKPTSSVEIAGEAMPDFFEDVKFMPKFQGGELNTFVTWVQRRVRYPEMAQQMGIQGEVIIRFMVEKDGTLSSFEVMSSTDKSLNNEALRVVKQSPAWTPGRQITEPVRVRMQIPVRFVLGN